MLTDEVVDQPLLKRRKLQDSTLKSLHQGRHPFAPRLPLKLEHSLIQFEILGQIPSALLAFTCWKQWLHLQVMIDAALNGQTQSVLRPNLRGSNMHDN